MLTSLAAQSSPYQNKLACIKHLLAVINTSEAFGLHGSLSTGCLAKAKLQANLQKDDLSWVWLPGGQCAFAH